LYNVQGAKTNGPPATKMLQANATEQQSCKHSDDSKKDGAADSKPPADTKKETKPSPDKNIQIESSTTEEATKPEPTEDDSVSREAK